MWGQADEQSIVFLLLFTPFNSFLLPNSEYKSLTKMTI